MEFLKKILINFNYCFREVGNGKYGQEKIIKFLGISIKRTVNKIEIKTKKVIK